MYDFTELISQQHDKQVHCRIYSANNLQTHLFPNTIDLFSIEHSGLQVQYHKCFYMLENEMLTVLKHTSKMKTTHQITAKVNAQRISEQEHFWYLSQPLVLTKRELYTYIHRCRLMFSLANVSYC